jgi:pullulanase
MFGKFMADSVRYWAEEYHLDGFRFDLMGLHDLSTMQKVEAAIHEVNPEALIYGEGWNMGSTMDGSPQANQGNIGKITKTNNAIGTIAVFNDVIRDGLKGSVFQTTSRGYISGEGPSNAGKVRFGISGGSLSGFGWKVPDSMVINYMSAHDNHSLWDKLALSNAADSPETRAEMNRLGAAVLMISRGTPFFQAGEEMLRSKDGDENSYKSSDAINNIRWDTLTPDSEAYRTMEYYRGLIAMRRAYGTFRYGEVSFTDLGNGRMEIRFGHSALAVINPTGDSLSYTLDGEWNLVADETAAGAGVILREQGEISVAARSIRIYVK